MSSLIIGIGLGPCSARGASGVPGGPDDGVFGFVCGYPIGGFIHILLVIAVIMILVNLISGRKKL